MAKHGPALFFEAPEKDWSSKMARRLLKWHMGEFSNWDPLEYQLKGEFRRIQVSPPPTKKEEKRSRVFLSVLDTTTNKLGCPQQIRVGQVGSGTYGLLINAVAAGLFTGTPVGRGKNTAAGKTSQGFMETFGFTLAMACFQDQLPSNWWFGGRWFRGWGWFPCTPCKN